MTQLLADPAIQLTLRLALAAMFAGAALHKARDLGGFFATLRNYQMLPRHMTPAAGAAVLSAEMAVAVALAGAAATLYAALGALALLGVYSFAIALNLARGRRDIDCGCLGPGHRQPLSEWLLVRNGIAAVAAALLLLPATTRPLALVDALSVTGGTVALALLWVAANGLLETWPRVRWVAS